MEDGYATACGGCGKEDCMEVFAGTFQAEGMPLTEDGFSTCDAGQFNTSDEIARCVECGNVQYLDGSPLVLAKRPRHPGIANVSEWVRNADSELHTWDRNREVNPDNAIALRDLVSQAERYFSGGGFAYALAETLREQDLPDADAIAIRVANSITGKKGRKAA